MPNKNTEKAPLLTFFFADVSGRKCSRKRVCVQGERGSARNFERNETLWGHGYRAGRGGGVQRFDAVSQTVKQTVETR